MGIKSLSKFLKDKYPNIFELIHISQYAYKRVAIDMSLYMCRFKTAYWNARIYGPYPWLNAFIRLVAVLRKNEIHCVFIYDSGFTKDKEEERKQRKEDRQKRERRVYDLETAIEAYHSTGEVKPILLEFQDKRKLHKPILLRQNIVSVNIRAVEDAVEKMRGQLISITPEDFAITKKVFDILQVPYFNAPIEAETMCADLCIQGKVDAVLSEDTDVLAYGAPVFLSKIDTRDESCLSINYSELLKQMEFTDDQFLDFCIMCGTDYNNNIPRVGPAKAFSLISEHKNIENVAKNTTYDVSILNHTRVRELFREYKKSDCQVNYCGRPNFSALQVLITTKNMRIDLEPLQKSFIRSVIIEEETDTVFNNEANEEIIIIDEEDEVIEIE